MSGDSVDANWLNLLLRGGSGEVENVISSKIPSCEKFSDFYNFTNKHRGIALIFNHEKFNDSSMNQRQGTDKDRDYLQKVLKKLDFDVRVYNDLKFSQIHDVLEEVSETDHSQSDCLIVCVMSHGESGKIHARDHTYPPDILWSPFTGDRCVTLASKPKLFFIQACRGDMVDDGAVIKDKTEHDSSGNGHLYTIPAMADILVMYSTYQGYFSWRSPDKGSWFIQALCHELEENYLRQDLLTILTFVNRRVAVNYQSNVPGSREMDKKKQICTIVSMLTRRMFFFPKKQLEMECENTDSNIGENDNKTE